MNSSRTLEVTLNRYNGHVLKSCVSVYNNDYTKIIDNAVSTEHFYKIVAKSFNSYKNVYITIDEYNPDNTLILYVCKCNENECIHFDYQSMEYIDSGFCDKNSNQEKWDILNKYINQSGYIEITYFNR